MRIVIVYLNYNILWITRTTNWICNIVWVYKILKRHNVAIILQGLLTEPPTDQAANKTD